jgi:hypothetical protein
MLSGFGQISKSGAGHAKFERKERLTRVEARTFLRRGKSEMPASRMDIEESRREREERREVTDALSDWRDCDCECDCNCDCNIVFFSWVFWRLVPWLWCCVAVLLWR